MRSLRSYISSPYNHCIRINTICPWMTQTDGIKKIEYQWREANLPINSPSQVAHISTAMLADTSLNGKSMFVEGGRAWEIEQNVDRLESQWLGEAPSKALAAGQELLGDGAIWTAKPTKRNSISVSGIPPGVPPEKQNGLQGAPRKNFINGNFTAVANGVH